MHFGATLRQVMRECDMTQSRLSGITGVPQGRISEYVNDRRTPSQDTLELLVGAMGKRPVLRVEEEPMGRSERRSWMLHRQLATHLDEFDTWYDRLLLNLDRLSGTVRGEPHRSNLDRWRQLIEQRDVGDIRRIMLDPSREGQEMREVGPFSGILPQEERRQVLERLGR